MGRRTRSAKRVDDAARTRWLDRPDRARRVAREVEEDLTGERERPQPRVAGSRSRGVRVDLVRLGVHWRRLRVPVRRHAFGHVGQGQHGLGAQALHLVERDLIPAGRLPARNPIDNEGRGAPCGAQQVAGLRGGKTDARGRVQGFEQIRRKPVKAAVELGHGRRRLALDGGQGQGLLDLDLLALLLDLLTEEIVHEEGEVEGRRAVLAVEHQLVERLVPGPDVADALPAADQAALQEILELLDADLSIAHDTEEPGC